MPFTLPPLTQELVLPFLCAGVIGFAINLYILLSGFDLGIGILFPFMKEKERQDIAMHAIAPLWDGNQTWLVLGGATLFAAFPKAYAIVLPALYLPLLLFLLGLIFRGVAFEFRFKATRHQYLWNWAFAGGSILATAMQGMMLGRFIEGFAFTHGRYSGTAFDWLTPFSLLTALALLCGYGLLGATWLNMKTEGELQEWCRRAALRLMFAVMVFLGIVSLWTPLSQAAIATRWFSLPNLYFFLPVPILSGVLTFVLFTALRAKRERLPFLASVGLFFLAYTGLAISLWPYIVPRELTIWDAAAPSESQLFVLIGDAVLIPIILIYTAHAYWVFRGKTATGEGYD